MKYIYLLFIISFSYINLSAQDILMQNGTFNQCSDEFFDSGDDSGNYSNNENFIITICPDTPNFVTTIIFTEFSLEDGEDFLTIYDSDTNDPAFEIGTFTGDLDSNPILENLAAGHTSLTGCLTFEFTSNDTVTDTGWSAEISCKEIINTCEGDFFDSGGPNGDFTLGEDLTVTICPDGPDLDTILEFSFFEMNSVHEMTIYDAADTSDPTTIIGVFTQTLADNPELNFVVATNPTGCLTINFDSAPFPFPPFTGWEAAISCRPPCQTITPQLISIDPTCTEDGISTNEFVSIDTPTTFTAGATTSSGVTDDLTYTWNFNGIIQTGQIVDQSFNNTGDVNVTLTVTDSFGCSETIDFIITVGDNLIIVDDINFTLDQLVSDILIQGECADISNINSPLNSNVAGAGFDSYGYFNRGCSSFPFEEGIVLSSQGMSGILNGDNFESNFGPGDPDLFELGGAIFNTFDATVIEFEFTPYIDEISFEYLFASNEYNFPGLSFVCSYADTFAFILSGPGIADTNNYDHDANPNTPDIPIDLGGLNIALVPGTNVPVSAVNVHTNFDADGDTNCDPGDLGEFAFPDFFDSANVPPNYHEYSGQMRPLTVLASVIPGQTYTIKLAISDFRDSSYNSAVFLEGGSFELGAKVGDDLVLDDVTAKCEGETQTLQVFNGIAPTGFTFQWSKDGVPIAGETGPTLDVTETGEYCIELAAGSDCDSSDCAVVEFIPVFDQSQDVNEILDINICQPFSSFPTFDLSINDGSISTNISNDFFNDYPDFQTENPGIEPYGVRYFETFADASNGTNPIPDPQNYSIDPLILPFTVYYSVEDTFGLGCFNPSISVGSFEIDTTETPVGPIVDLASCSNNAGEDSAFFDLTQNNTNALDGEDPAEFVVTYYTSEQNAIDDIDPILTPDNFENTVNPQTIWVKLDNLESEECFSLATFELAVDVIPEITTMPTDLSACGDFTLTQSFDLSQYDATNLGISNGSQTDITFHNTLPDAEANTNPILDPANYSPSNNLETIFIRAENINTTACFSTASFEIQVFDVEAIQPEDIVVCEQTGDTGISTWDLTVQNADVFGPNQDSTTHSISYHTSQADAQGGASPIPNPTNYTNTSNPEIVWVRVQNIGDPTCSAVSSFELSITEEPEIVNSPSDLSECGDFTGSQTFDLTQNDVAALGILNPAQTALSYYTSNADAIAGANNIPDPANYLPSANPETIFIRAENTADDTCFVTTSFEIQIFDVQANQAENINVCAATGNTGQTQFDLTLQNADVFGPNQDSTTHSISYHTSQIDAEGGASPIPNPTNYTNTTNPETVWVRVQNIADPTCSAVSSFELSITEEPEIVNSPSDLSECGDFTGSQTFDLTQNDVAALGILNPAETALSYYTSNADAIAGANNIPDPVNYLPSANPETIFIRAENTTDDTCFVTANFEIELFDVEVLPVNDLESCDDGTGTATSSFDLTSNNTLALGVNQNTATHNISYHISLAEANTGANPIPTPATYDNTSSPQTIWVRVENVNNTTCFAVGTFQLLVTDSAPINTNIDPFIACDDDNDGFFNNFDLSLITDQINFGNPDVVVTYHLTSSDAQNGVGVLSSPYANVVESVQTIYFRAVDTNNGCEQFGDFELQVFDSPLLTPIEDILIGCDDDNDGFLLFDLTQVEAEVLGDLDPTNLVITYHLSLANAQTGDNPIIDPENYQNASSPQTIWIRVTDSASPVGCFDIETFEIIVEPTPDIVNPEPLEVCDDEESGDLSDEIATFDLNDKIAEITQGNNELNVEFFESQADLDNDNPINPIDSYVNIANPQTLEVKVTSGTNGCSSFTTLTLVVNPVPSMAPELEPLEICDPDNDGFAEFDLEEAIIDILNNEPDVSITFHLTLADAELGANPIDTSSPFGTSNPDQQTIYVRAENTGPNGDDGTGCFDTRPLDLIVIPSPDIEELEDLSRCDDESPNGFASFDLTVNTPLALGNQDAVDNLVTYHETQLDAEQGTNPIAVPSNYTNISNPQIIYVRIENIVTGCIDLFDTTDDVNNTFTLTVEPLPIVNTPSVLEVCDDDNNPNPFPQTTFDLTVKEPEIVGQAAVPANLQFSYYESQADLDADNAIADPTAYVNTSQPQSIYIKVVNNATQNDCFDTTVLTISVLPLPSPSETDPDVLRLIGCDGDNDGVANQPFDLTDSGVLISGSENVDLSYYLTESGANTQDVNDLIATPDAYVNQPSFNLIDENGNPTNTQVIYVRVDNGVAGNFCYVIVPFELVVNQAPELNPNGDPFAYTLCEDDDANPGIATLFSIQDITNNLWDFTNGSSDVIIPLLDPNVSPAQNIDDFAVTYHFTEQDALTGLNAIAAGESVSDGDILFIRVRNEETTCFNSANIGQVQMVIQPRPAIATDNPDNIVICAEDINSPSAGTVDLTGQDEAINPGAPANTLVIYYAGMMDYNNGTPIEDPTNFTTTQSPQTIIAEVINTETLCESSSFVSFELIVNPLPMVDISGFDGLLVCFDSAGNLVNNDISPPTIDTGLSEDIYDFVWAVDGVPLPNVSSSIEAVLPGIYTVTVTNTQTGCEASSSAEIIESSPPEFEVRVLTPSFSGSHVVEVSNIMGSGDFEFQLDDGEWISLAPGQTTLVFSNIAQGVHVITGRDSGGCGEIEVAFTLIDFPPFFTPNQDGFNDTWNITGLTDQPNAKIYIFDRYGKLLKQISPAGEGWDGTYNGKNMPAQDYWFRVEFEEPTTEAPSIFKAHFTLKR